MPTVESLVSCPVYDSFRVQQVAGMFDLPSAERSTVRFEVELPDDGEDWQVGLIVGPSGSGKSTTARTHYGDRVVAGHDWPAEKAVIDCFEDAPTRAVVDVLTAVGFSSPPAWIKPYGVLSGGERFRCDLARALLLGGGVADGQARPIIVFDEFTSVVDRTVARASSVAIGKAVRGGLVAKRFVGVTCHYDVAEWLEADWVLDMANGRLERRRLRRPPINVEVARCKLEAWSAFMRHHYLTGTLAPQSRCYLATWVGEPVTFCATLPVIAKKHHRRFTRIVTLPDYQGMGIGMKVVAAVADIEHGLGYRVNVTSSHPALIRHCKASPHWRAVNVKKRGSSPSKSKRFSAYRNSAGRAVVSFEHLGRINPDAHNKTTETTR